MEGRALLLGLRMRFPGSKSSCRCRGGVRSLIKKQRQTRFSHLKRLCFNKVWCEKSEEEADEQQHQNQNQNRNQIRKPECLLLERYRDGTAKRYMVDPNSQLQTIPEEQAATLIIDDDDDDDGHKNNSNNNNKGPQNDSFWDLAWLPPVITEFVLPAGFPGSVSDDYLEYMLLQFPTNVTGWICYTLVTSSLLKGVGIGSFTGTSAAASAAAIRWVSKDGLGAIGRLFIGGRYGTLFDNDPKQWRMYADFIGSTGSIFELTTQLYPAYFLPLASLGNLAKAIARGLKDPSFRVIQNHFAISGNLGEVAAKEEVWEVTAQIVGLAIGILIMDIVPNI